MRTIAVSKAENGFTVTVTLPENATRWDVSAALTELLRLTPFITNCCPGCGVVIPAKDEGWRVHALGCPIAPAGFLGLLTEEARKEGYRP